MKDPVLLSYTFEELMYEFHSIHEHHAAKIEMAEEESDKIEEEADEAVNSWADEMEREEEAMAAAEKAELEADPSKDPANIAWMEEEIRKNKELLGDDFGEDVSLDFDSNNT